MEFAYIVFVWVAVMIIIYGRKWYQEKKKKKKVFFKNPMAMSIGEILKRKKRKYRW